MIHKYSWVATANATDPDTFDPLAGGMTGSFVVESGNNIKQQIEQKSGYKLNNDGTYITPDGKTFGATTGTSKANKYGL